MIGQMAPMSGTTDMLKYGKGMLWVRAQVMGTLTYGKGMLSVRARAEDRLRYGKDTD